jgi:multicomponent K+:H+ antiporter subunit D
MTKVGVYIVLRLTSLLFGDKSGGAANFADAWLIWGGLATMVYGTIGILSARKLSRIAGHYLLVSSGTLLAAIGIGGNAVMAALLFYLVSSTLAVGALYLIIEPVVRNVEGDDEIPGIISEPVFDDEYTGAPEEDEDESGIVIPGTIAVLGGGFIFCTLLLAGLPPLSGFIAKFAIIDALFRSAVIAPTSWLLIALVIGSSLATLIGLTRAGIDLLWTPAEDNPPRLSVIEVAPIGLLLATCLALMLAAGPVFLYMEATAVALGDRSAYIEAVLHAPRAGEELS